MDNQTQLNLGFQTQSLPWVTDKEQSLSKNEMLYLIQKVLVDNA